MIARLPGLLTGTIRSERHVIAELYLKPPLFGRIVPVMTDSCLIIMGKKIVF
jgi:hypothetical protein